MRECRRGKRQGGISIGELRRGRSRGEEDRDKNEEG